MYSFYVTQMRSALEVINTLSAEARKFELTDGHLLIIRDYKHGWDVRIDTSKEWNRDYQYEPFSPCKLYWNTAELILLLAHHCSHDDQIIAYRISDEIRFNIGAKEDLQDHHLKLSYREVSQRYTTDESAAEALEEIAKSRD